MQNTIIKVGDVDNLNKNISDIKNELHHLEISINESKELIESENIPIEILEITKSNLILMSIQHTQLSSYGRTVAKRLKDLNKYFKKLDQTT